MDPHTLLISYPRSGCNWIRYCVEFLSRRPTPGHPRLVKGRENRVFDRTHCVQRVGPLDYYNKIMLTIRNYKECLITHIDKKFKESDSIGEFLTLKDSPQPPECYIMNIKEFDLFRREKLLIYYEDLLTKPEVEITRLINFLDIPDTYVREFFDNLEHHREESVKRYQYNHVSLTKGDPRKILHHSNLLTGKQKGEFDEFYKDNYPCLFSKYLKCYEEPIKIQQDLISSCAINSRNSCQCYKNGRNSFL